MWIVEVIDSRKPIRSKLCKTRTLAYRLAGSYAKQYMRYLEKYEGDITIVIYDLDELVDAQIRLSNDY